MQLLEGLNYGTHFLLETPLRIIVILNLKQSINLNIWFQFVEGGGFTLDRPRPQTNLILETSDPFNEHHQKSG